MSQYKNAPVFCSRSPSICGIPDPNAPPPAPREEPGLTGPSPARGHYEGASYFPTPEQDLDTPTAREQPPIDPASNPQFVPSAVDAGVDLDESPRKAQRNHDSHPHAHDAAHDDHAGHAHNNKHPLDSVLNGGMDDPWLPDEDLPDFDTINRDNSIAAEGYSSRSAAVAAAAGCHTAFALLAAIVLVVVNG